MKNFSFILLLIIFNFAFKSDSCLADSTNTKFKISDFVVKASNLLKGEIIKAERKFKSGKGLWEIKISADDGGIVQLDFDLKTSELLEAESSEGPFNYNFTPFSNYIDLQSAKIKTENELGMKIMKWEFKPIKEKWEWRFWYLSKTGSPQLRVDAETGEFITSGKK